MSDKSENPTRPSRAQNGLRAALATVAAAAFVLMSLTPAHARLDDETPAGEAAIGANTEIRVSGLGAGLTVSGGLPPTVIVQDPTAPYPAAPPPGYAPQSSFAGVIETQSIDDPSLTGEMYCINIRVPTYVDTGYESGSWEESAVPNIGYVTYILNNYYPTVAAPAGLTVNQQAAATQAAIWYFTDGFVLTGPPPVRNAAAAIIAAAQANGPVVEPPAPQVDITPTSAEAAEGTAAGPYVVTAEGATTITVSVPAGYTMYSDAAATTPIANPSSVAPGTSIWITGPGVTAPETVLSARAAVTVQRGNVYLYDGNTPGRPDAQRLILADTAELEAVASATTEFFAVGDLTVNKEFTGGAVGEQGAIQLAIDCGEGYTFTADIPAATSTTQTFTYPGIPAGNTCTVTEPTTGATAQVLVTTNAPQGVVMADEGSAVTIINQVEFAPGSLSLVKAIAGGGAGSQDAISVSVTCVSGLTDVFVIPAGSAAGEYTRSYPGLPAGDECTVAELASGENTVVTVTSDAPVTVTIAPGAAAEARVTNTVEFRPGSLDLTKLVDGAAAGSQSDIVVGITCDNGLDETFTIPAGSQAGEYTQSYEEIPAGTVCTVTELESGSNSVVEVVGGQTVSVTIEPAAASAVELSNTVTFRPGGLNVVKVITGAAAGLQSAISLEVTCDNGLAETVDIPAGAAAGEYVESFSDLPAGTECTVTELESGANSSVSVTTEAPVTVTIAPGEIADATLTNTVVSIGTAAGRLLAVTGGNASLATLLGGAGFLGIGLLLVLTALWAGRRRTT
ncbi:TQXA domain-containing protein [Salinibacterium sp. dk2585]|uniref:thioester domain-containing protein n=1 Tax=unclassified Salinibacterium TaxID=2632331 RepID=UPI0011C2431E|nr:MULTISPECIES: thioester domain-containing protein [unclassified Salinibacterium]QEE60558.1 TQXA domain-containing protein [Salinibacterium sp. dk2585]TXK55630.1 TQXA domain-containing protein [Salinibacterium sp. dk5596]